MGLAYPLAASLCQKELMLGLIIAISLVQKLINFCTGMDLA